MPPRKDKKQARQNQILEAAMEVFVRLGFDKARMDDIAAAAGVSKGSLYWHFKSKEDIISAVLYRLFQGELGDLREIRALEVPADEKLRRFAQQLAQDMQAMQRWQPLMAEFYAVATRHKSAHLFLQHYYQDYIDLLAAIIEEGIDRGLFRVGDARAAAFTLTAAAEGVILLCSLELGRKDWGEQMQSTLFHILDGFLNHDDKTVSS
jgi:AcrR family transcriptional regulator